MMNRQAGTSGVSKRKRRPSSSPGIENKPYNDKKVKEETNSMVNFIKEETNSMVNFIKEDENHSSDERVPLTELMLTSSTSPSPKEKNDFLNELRAESEHLTDCEWESIGSEETLSEESTDDESYFKTIDEGGGYDSETLNLDSIALDSSSKSTLLPDWPGETSVDIWEFYRRERENETRHRSVLAFDNHPNLKPRMRSVLFEWIFEVCDVYKLHRETYYLAIDYFDRYLFLSENIKKGELQLIGVTCLLIASKYEEIYPPKVNEFAYITDGACTEEDIVKEELKIIKILDWKCAIISANSWLSVFTQLIYHKRSKQRHDIRIPQYSVKTFQRVSQLLDLSSMDEGFLNFPYKILAATALYLACSEILALSVSGFTLEDINSCVKWMEAFWEVLQDTNGYDRTEFSDFSPSPISIQQPIANLDFSHTIIKHNVSLDLLEAGKTILKERSILEPPNQIPGLLTPPSSSKKSLKNS